ncbi:hypothetical protein PISL3812_00680 [Talaromyces islandicus]|uniref:Amino acid transporter transmembrane domain-containing protein n=1 Tax=Talaromyces islandicus TaxID=28573 RepID=A0A0U1LJY5_TALIS|nr:hypothetical protein PISL3812_00680 [Talaromyces islandicus]
MMSKGTVIPPDSGYIKPQARAPHDPNVAFEEYHYYAQKTREEEDSLQSPKLNIRQLISRKKNTQGNNTDENPTATLTEKDYANVENRREISDEEWANASRALRTASTGACELIVTTQRETPEKGNLLIHYSFIRKGFYLITTDVLGPYGSAFAMGIALYTVFGFMAGYSGYLVWRVFLGVDSHQFPARNYGDIAFRTWGSTVRYITNLMQAIALLLLIGQVTIQFGENISQVSKFRLCYAVCPVLFVCVGFFVSQIRTLRSFGWIANFAVWANLLVIFISMGVIAHSSPNFAISTLGSAGSAVNPDTITPVDGKYPPVMHYSGLPPNGLVGSINGLLSAVLAYAGIQLFVEFMAEMRRPRDFIKAMWGAQFFVYSVYLIYGCFVYHYQGQYSFNPSYQGVSIYSWQTVGNMISLISALIAAGLYGNIGVKVVYNNVFMDLFRAPPLTTKLGKVIYAILVPIFWVIAFIIAAAIPDYFGFVSVMSASMLLNMTYTLPPLFALGFDIQKNAVRIEDGEGFDPNTGRVIRQESTVQRWVRGFWSGGAFQVAINIWHVLYLLASLAMSGLGMYAAIEGMIEAFKIPELNSFSCTSPLDLSSS